jgi:hypothetical protein
MEGKMTSSITEEPFARAQAAKFQRAKRRKINLAPQKRNGSNGYDNPAAKHEHRIQIGHDNNWLYYKNRKDNLENDELMPPYAPEENAKAQLSEYDPSFLAKSSKYTQPLISQEFKETSSFYTLGEFLRRNLGKLREEARQKEIPKNDINDVVDDAILDFINNEKVSMNKMHGRNYIESFVKPTIMDYLNARIMIYHAEKEFQPDSNIADEPKELQLDRPAHYIILEMIGEFPLRESDAEPDEPYEIKEPVSSKFMLEEQNVMEWLEKEIKNSFIDVPIISQASLRGKYDIKPNSKIFQQYAVMEPTAAEERIADYVADGSWTLDKHDLLIQPLFYEALFNVIHSQSKTDERSSYSEASTFEPMRARGRKIKHGEHGNANYEKLRAKLSGHLPSDTISELLEESAKEDIGRTNLARLRASLPNHGGRKNSPSAKELYETALDVLTLKLQKEYGLQPDVARLHALHMPELMRTY